VRLESREARLTFQGEWESGVGCKGSQASASVQACVSVGLRRARAEARGWLRHGLGWLGCSAD
jgi:hypothetical protein